MTDGGPAARCSLPAAPRLRRGVCERRGMDTLSCSAAMARPPGLIPAPPPTHQLQRRLYKCPHTGAVRVALTRVAPVPPDMGEPAGDKNFSTVLRRLHATKCNARVRQLPRRRLPTVAATAKVATAATSALDSGAAAPARPTGCTVPETSCRFGSRQTARTLAAEQERGAAVSVAREVVDSVLEACIADIGFEALLADGEARLDNAHRAVRSARVHDGCGYLQHAKERFVERMNTPVDDPKQHSPDSRMEHTPHEGGARLVDSHLHHTPPHAWGFATEEHAEHDRRAVTPRAIDAHRQRSARRRIGLLSAIDPWATTAPADGGAACKSRQHSPVQSLKAKVAVHKRVAAQVRGGGITARIWAPHSTPETRRAPDPVARPFPFAGTKPFPATTRDHYIYPSVPNHYHLACETASDHAKGDSMTPLGEAKYTSVQVKQVDRRRIVHVSHTEVGHAAQQLLRNGTRFRWETNASGRVVVATPATPTSVPACSAGQAWAAAVEHPLPKREFPHSWDRGEWFYEKLGTPLTVRHLLSAGAVKQNIG